MRAPWNDFNGNPIYVGDRIRHPTGDEGTVVLENLGRGFYETWRVRYDDGISLWLGIQIGDKGCGVVVPKNESSKPRIRFKGDRYWCNTYFAIGMGFTMRAAYEDAFYSNAEGTCMVFKIIQSPWGKSRLQQLAVEDDINLQ